MYLLIGFFFRSSTWPRSMLILKWFNRLMSEWTRPILNLSCDHKGEVIIICEKIYYVLQPKSINEVKMSRIIKKKSNRYEKHMKKLLNDKRMKDIKLKNRISFESRRKLNRWNFKIHKRKKKKKKHVTINKIVIFFMIVLNEINFFFVFEIFVQFKPNLKTSFCVCIWQMRNAF